MDGKKIAVLVHQMLDIIVDLRAILKVMEEILPTMHGYGVGAFSVIGRYFFGQRAADADAADEAHNEKTTDAKKTVDANAADDTKP
jgi:hypothetical protein